MSLYCGIDLHSTNHLVVITDEEDRRVLEKRLANECSLLTPELTNSIFSTHRPAHVGKKGLFSHRCGLAG